MSARKHKRSSNRPKPHRSSVRAAAIASPQEQKQFLNTYNARNFIEAQRYAETLTQRYPKDAFGWKVLGSCLHKNGEIAKARDALSQSLDIEAKDAQAQHLMARVWYDLGEPGKALAYARKAVSLEPEFAQGHFTLAEILTENDKDQEALDHAMKAESLGHDENACLFIRGHIQTKRRHYQEAFDIIQQLAERDPRNPFVQNEIANLYKDLGQFEQAEAAYRQALELDPQFDVAFSNLLICMHYNPAITAEQIFTTIREWESHFPNRLEQYQHSADSTAANKIIRIGMVSPGFRMHPVGQMILTGLEQLEPGFELHFYSTNNADDDLTRRLKKVATSWNLVRHLGQDELADRIHQDGIDILFDLSGYGEGSRLHTLSRKPAPLIVKWVGGLINTMGLSAFDYLISDINETPEGVDGWYTEKLIRLPNDYICYLPALDAPPITALPAMSNGYITLGCFNNPAKINPELLSEWAKLMHELPDSRLLLKSGQYDSSEYCARIRGIMQEHGIEAERLILEGPAKHRDLLEAYNRVDIALDTWPYSGGLTTCEAFMMGVPVVTLPGPTFAGRHSATHLINAGMPELVVNSWDEYRQRVIELASDLPNLSVIRACLRQFLMQSPVCDAEIFGKHFSTTMRAIWQRYCNDLPTAALDFNEDSAPVFKGDEAPWVLPEQPENSGTPEQHNSIDSITIPDRPHMSDEELALFERCLAGAKSYFEFGTGGSTVLAVSHGLTVQGIESDQSWVEALQSRLGQPCQIKWCDIGKTGDWGFPVDSSMKEAYPRFSQAIMDEPDEYDLVLVDGRFRTACILTAVKKALTGQQQEMTIFIHDFWNRSQYHAALLFLEHIESANTAGVFRPRKDVDLSLLSEIYRQYAHDPH